jgi:hypothetical protein
MAQELYQDIRTGNSTDMLKQAILENLCYGQGQVPELATKNDWYMVAAIADDKKESRSFNLSAGIPSKAMAGFI